MHDSKCIMTKLVGTWQQVSSENFDAFLAAAGIDGARAEKARGPQVPEQWSVDGDVITASRLVPNQTMSVKFKLGEEFTDPTIGNYKSKFTVEEGKLVRRGSTNGHEVSAIREVKDGVQIMTMTCNGVSCTKNFKKI